MDHFDVFSRTDHNRFADRRLFKDIHFILCFFYLDLSISNFGISGIITRSWKLIHHEINKTHGNPFKRSFGIQ